MRIYLASSWKNLAYVGILHVLRKCGHEVYDFRQPATAFRWSDISTDIDQWTTRNYIDAFTHPLVARAYASDKEALDNCDACILVLPAGNSASWELGYAMAKGKKSYVVQLENGQPDLMFREATFLCGMQDIFTHFDTEGKLR